MNTLKIFASNKKVIGSSIDDIHNLAGQITQEYHLLESLNWSKFEYKPHVLFGIIQFADGIFLKFKVEEENLRAMVTIDNGPVYTDSCVELFIDPTGTGYYYNFEFNCTGKLLLGYGNSRHHRELASEEILGIVKRRTSVSSGPFESLEIDKWEIEVFIPFQAFFKDQISGLHSAISRCNLYKCGDLTKNPHYVTWSPIITAEPDFHRPEFFGNIEVIPILN